jgi:23S rRNA (uracil1939-C5)-methyltransferase
MPSAFETKIEKLVYGGDGLAHSEGNTVFVPYVIPGELVRVQPVETRKKFVRGHIEKLLQAAPERIAAPCPQFGVCGGCNYQHIPYESQLMYKREILRETLARIGKLEPPNEIRTVSAEPFGYRNRAQWAVRPSGDPPRPAIGYFQPASSTLAPADVCPILAPRLETTLGLLSRAFAEGTLPGSICTIESFINHAGEQLLMNLVVADKMKATAIAARLREILTGVAVQSLLVHDEKNKEFDLDGPGYIQYEAGGHSYRVGHLSFFQVNRFLVDEMARAVVDGSGQANKGLAIDLYAGVGLFSVPLCSRFERVIAVEGDVAGVRDLEANLKAFPNGRARHMDTESFLQKCKDKPELIIADPPRAGVSRSALQKLRDIAAPRITYLSCDPATLARDLAILTNRAYAGAPYSISDITLYDIFPQTYHIEALVNLQRLA